MYKVIWLVRFRRDVPREDVLAWWRGPHAALAAATPGMVRYVQSHWLAPLDPATCLPRAGESPEFDGHAEHWFESREGVRHRHGERGVGFDESRRIVALRLEHARRGCARGDRRAVGRGERRMSVGAGAAGHIWLLW